MQLSSLNAENGPRMQCAAVPPSEGSPPHHFPQFQARLMIYLVS
jgi:hypothetical protein